MSVLLAELKPDTRS